MAEVTNFQILYLIIGIIVLIAAPFIIYDALFDDDVPYPLEPEEEEFVVLEPVWIPPRPPMDRRRG